MEHTRSYSVKDVLAALGKSLLYLLFFIMAQFLTGVVYTAAVAVRTALVHREMDIAEAAQLAAERLLAGAPAVALLANVFVVAVLLLWFRLRHKPLGKAAGLRRCSGWTAAFSAFAALGLFVAINLALALLPEAWLTAYNADMAPIASTGLFTALSIVVVGPLAEELVFRGIIQTRLLRAMPPWTAVVLQAALFGIITYYIAFGADAGFGAFTSGLAGFSSAEHPLLTGEVLRVIRSLADEHMTMVIVTHEMPFARAVSDRVVFLDGGVIVEQGSPEQVFENPQQERTKEFLQSYRETSSAQA